MLKNINAKYMVKKALLAILCFSVILSSAACGAFDEITQILEGGNDSRPESTVSGDESNDSEDVTSEIPDTASEHFVTSAYGEGLIINGYNGTDTFVKIPAEIDGKAVVAIGANAVKDIVADEATLCITDIVVPDSVKQIAFSAFSGCKGLVSLTVPFVGGKETENNYLGYVFGAYTAGGNKTVLPESLTTVVAGGSTVADDAFINCESLQNIVLSDVISVGKNAFNGCTSLKKLYIPDTVTSIGDGALGGCSSLYELTLPFLGNGSDKLFFGAVFGAESYAQNNDFVPESLRKVTLGCPADIPEGAFYECNRITYLTITGPVNSVGAKAFYRCRKLKSLEIIGGEGYGGIDAVSAYSFAYCAALGEVRLDGGITKIPEGAFYGCSSLRSVYFGDTANVMPSTVTTLEKGAFAYCESLTAMELSTTLTVIEEQTFYGCAYLLSINIPASVTEIKKDAFKGCGNLKTLTVGDNLTTIGYGAFSYCTVLMAVSLGDNVSVFGDYAFAYCKYLSDVTIKCNDAKIGKGVFDGCERIIVTVDPNSGTYESLIEAGLGNTNLKAPA